jgi:hypothetical protein
LFDPLTFLTDPTIRVKTFAQVPKGDKSVDNVKFVVDEVKPPMETILYPTFSPFVSRVGPDIALMYAVKFKLLEVCRTSVNEIGYKRIELPFVNVKSNIRKRADLKRLFYVDSIFFLFVKISSILLISLDCK